MRTLLLSILIAACTAGRVLADPAEDALRGKAETCIRAAAPEAAAKAENIEDAVFALGWLCGVEISRLDAYDKNARTLADWEGRSSSAQLAGVALDPVTGELQTPPGFKMEWNSASAEIDQLTRVTIQEEMDAVAAKAVLGARKPMKDQ